MINILRGVSPLLAITALAVLVRLAQIRKARRFDRHIAIAIAIATGPADPRRDDEEDDGPDELAGAYEEAFNVIIAREFPGHLERGEQS